LFKNPNLIEAEFHDHWRNHHARNPLESMKKLGVVKYTQYHCTESTRSLLKPMVDARENNPASELKFEIIPFDAIVQIWFRGYETWEAMATEPIFGDAIFQDESYLFDCSRSFTTLGWEEDMLVDNEIMMPDYQGLSKCLCKCRSCSSKGEAEGGKAETKQLIDIFGSEWRFSKPNCPMKVNPKFRSVSMTRSRCNLTSSRGSPAENQLFVLLASIAYLNS
jgi:hypothetical protein